MLPRSLDARQVLLPHPAHKVFRRFWEIGRLIPASFLKLLELKSLQRGFTSGHETPCTCHHGIRREKETFDDTNRLPIWQLYDVLRVVSFKAFRGRNNRYRLVLYGLGCSLRRYLFTTGYVDVAGKCSKTLTVGFYGEIFTVLMDGG